MTAFNQRTPFRTNAAVWFTLALLCKYARNGAVACNTLRGNAVAMGCAGSKEAAPSDTSKPLAEENNDAATQNNNAQENSDAGAASGTPTRTLDDHDESGSLSGEVSPRLSQVRESQPSVRYQAREMPSSRRSLSRRRSSSASAAPFDQAQVGTHTRHGIMPGPRGFSAAKINQDRGVVCWPVNGSCNQALLCIFDGHGSKGELVSEFCMKVVPELLEAEPDALQADPAGFLTKSIIKCDELLFAGSARPTAPAAPAPAPQPQPQPPAPAPSPTPQPPAPSPQPQPQPARRLHASQASSARWR